MLSMSKFGPGQEVICSVDAGPPRVGLVARVNWIGKADGDYGPVRYEVAVDGVVREYGDDDLELAPTRDAAICELLKIREMIGETGAGQDHTHAEVAVHALIGRLTEAHETLGIADARWRQIEDVVGMSDPVGAVRALGVANDELTARVQELEEELAVTHSREREAIAVCDATRDTLAKATTELGEVRAVRRNFEQSLRARVVDAKAGTSGSLVLDFERPSIPRSASRTLATIVDEVVAFDAGRNGDGPARVLAAAAILLDCARHVVAILDGSAHEPTT